MYEFLTNPPWWVVLILSITLAKLWDKLEIGVKAMASYFMTHATGKLKRFLMGRKIKHLRNIKATRFSQLSILRLTIKSYAYLTLFVICALVALLIAYTLQVTAVEYTKTITPALAFALSTTLIFEVLWLYTSSKVNDLIKYNRKIRVSKHRSNQAKAQQGATQKEIEVEILLTYYRNHYEDNIFSKPRDFEYEYYDESKKSGLLLLKHGTSKIFCHEFSIINAEVPGEVCLTLGKQTLYIP